MPLTYRIAGLCWDSSFCWERVSLSIHDAGALQTSSWPLMGKLELTHLWNCLSSTQSISWGKAKKQPQTQSFTISDFENLPK